MMDIRQAKEELRRTLLAYQEKTGDGRYRIPLTSQRPMLLMGPPGVGKTAIVYQLAQEMGVGLVAYTMTHHTRQSALGLPRIQERVYGGKAYLATEYTMSEIIAAVYEQMEKTGLSRGILFLDEINCVSETLMPAMLQLLQSKRFGVHQLPEGWCIVAAGNPPRYNQAARGFDTVTLDRVRLLEIQEDFSVWQSYGAQKGIHPAILSYLRLNPEHFYCIEGRGQGRSFVTARGWEDLSLVLKAYEALGFPIQDALFGEFLQHEEIAASFGLYYRLAQKARGRLDLPAILSGQERMGPGELASMGFDGRLAVVEIISHGLGERLMEWKAKRVFAEQLSYFVGALPEAGCMDFSRQRLQMRKKALEVQKSCGVVSEEAMGEEEGFLKRMGDFLKEQEGKADQELFCAFQAYSSRLSGEEEEMAKELHRQMDSAMAYVYHTFGADQELLVFLTQLEAIPQALLLWKRYGEGQREALLDLVLPERIEERLS